MCAYETNGHQTPSHNKERPDPIFILSWHVLVVPYHDYIGEGFSLSRTSENFKVQASGTVALNRELLQRLSDTASSGNNVRRFG